MKEKKSSCIFSCNTKHISFYPFYIPVIYMLFRFCKDQIVGISGNGNLKILKYNLPYMFYLYLPKILAIIFIPIIKSRTKGDSHEVNRLSKQYHLVVIQKSKKKCFY